MVVAVSAGLCLATPAGQEAPTMTSTSRAILAGVGAAVLSAAAVAQLKMSRADAEKTPYTIQIRLETRPAQRVAAYRYTGRTREWFERDAIGHLRAWVRTQGLAATGESVVAYYDAPVVLPFLRRNEVMLRVS
jgi:hypothetical protein